MPQTMEEKILFDVMSFLHKQRSPEGAGSVQRYLENKGHTMAEATVGRLLREMDDRGYTEKRSNQGRTLSERGLARFRELEMKQWQEQWAEGFIGPSGAMEPSKMLELLAARIPVETEIAKLAATNATAEDVQSLRALVEKQEALAQKGEPVSDLDTEFHRSLAKASKNSVLEAVVELLRKKEEYTQEFESIRKQAGHIYNSEHRKIFEAIEQRDPELAQLTMRRHLDSLAAAVPKQ